jgi:hypothetical protein
MPTWMVRAGSGAENVTEFLKNRVVAFGDERLGKLQLPMTKQALLKLYAEKYPDAKEASRASWASQLLRLATEIAVGDTVLTYDPDARVYLIGKVTSGYEWMPGPVDGFPEGGPACSNSSCAKRSRAARDVRPPREPPKPPSSCPAEARRLDCPSTKRRFFGGGRLSPG